MKYLGIDFGSKKVGIAISDEEGKFAVPYRVLANESGLVEMISQIIRDQNIKWVVIGESKNFKGEDNKIMEEIKKFADLLKANTNIDIAMEPEFFSSVQAERELNQRRPDHHGGARNSRRSKPKDDSLSDARAAAIVLQSFLDRKVD